jgi:hypothetical protein
MKTARFRVQKDVDRWYVLDFQQEPRLGKIVAMWNSLEEAEFDALKRNLAEEDQEKGKDAR